MSNNERTYDPFSGGSGKIELDFPALKVWWMNGNSQMPTETGVPHFGGWAVHEADMLAHLDEASVNVPLNFAKKEMRSRKGQAYVAYLSRTIAIAPILRRSGWFQNRDTGKNYSALNILGYMAEIDKAKQAYIPWGFALLSAHVFSGVAIDTALATWKRQVAPAIKKLGAPVELGNLWVVMGTIGQTIVTESKGKGNQQSPITPCQCVTLKEITSEFLNKRKIAEEIAAVCAEARETSMEWAAAWNERKSDKAEVSGEEETTAANGFVNDDGIPF